MKETLVCSILKSKNIKERAEIIKKIGYVFPTTLEGKKKYIDHCFKVSILFPKFSVMEVNAGTIFYYIHGLWKERILKQPEGVIKDMGCTQGYYGNYFEDIREEDMIMINHIFCRGIEELCFLTRYKRIGYCLARLYLNNKGKRLTI